MITVDKFCKKEFGRKLYKLSFAGGFSCPNRDGKIGVGGCIFCSAGGSGEFAVRYDIKDPDESFRKARSGIRKKYDGDSFIAYFQAFSNTYGDISYLRKLYMSVIKRPDVYVLSIATRPDCLDENVYELLKELNSIKPVWVELGLQTSKESSVKYIRRGYDNEVYKEAVKRLNEIGIHVITHIILYLPNEDIEDMKNTVRYAIDCGSKGIKLQLLLILKGTDLLVDYNKDPSGFYIPSMQEYMTTLSECISLLPKDCVVHRLSADPPAKLLVEPKWALDKKKVLNAIKDVTDPPVPYSVYIIECEDHTLYTGSTNDIDKRFKKHAAGAGAKYTRAHKPKQVVYLEKLDNKRKALQREIEIKKLSRNEKLQLCNMKGVL